MEQVLAAKNEGNSMFKEKDYKKANLKYNEALRLLGEVSEGGDDLKAEMKTTKVNLLCNQAACALVQLENESATATSQRTTELADRCLKACEDALSLNGVCVKALYRKAQVLYKYKKDLNGAMIAVKMLLTVEKNNADALKFMKVMRNESIDKQSNTSQAIELLKKLKTEDNEEVTKQLKRVLGSILDDPMLAKNISLQNGCALIWDLYITGKSNFALVVLSKFADYADTALSVATAVDVLELQQALCRDDEALDGVSRAAALQIISRLALNENVKDEKLTDEFVLGSCVEALGATQYEDLRRTGVECVIRYCGEDKARCVVFVEGCSGLNALMKMITPEKNNEKEKEFKDSIAQVSVVLGRILPSLKDDDKIKNYALEFCKPELKSTDIYAQLKGAAALLAIFIANKELGCAICEDAGFMDLLNELARSSPSRTQAVLCEVFSHLANTESGRAVLNNGETTILLQVLVQSDTPAVRSSAAVALAKLNAIDFKSDSNEGAIVLETVLRLLKSEASLEEHKKGIEAVSFVISDTDVKMSLCRGDGMRVLQELVKIAQKEDTAKEPFAYGLSHVFENLTMSEDDKKREKLREMEVTEEQWQQFEKLTKSETRKGKPDPPQNVEYRIKSFIHADGAAAMRALVMNGGSERVCQAIARTFCNVATVKDTRGQLFKQGAARALIKLATDGEDTKTHEFATHALGKMFITTDPNLIGHNIVMDVIPPLVRQVRHSESDLMVFECTMALTNLSTLNQATKRKIITSNALKALEYASYSDNNLVRRAAVEAINNLIPEEETLEWFKVPQHMKIWLMFASDYETDMETARAACGALANLCADPEIAKLVEEQENGLPTIVVLLGCGISEIVHRVAVVVLQLFQSLEDGKAKLNALKLEDFVLKAADCADPGPAADTVKALLEQL